LWACCSLENLRLARAILSSCDDRGGRPADHAARPLADPIQWTPEQQEQIQAIARDTIPGIKTHAIPTGLQVQVGPDGIVKYLMERIDDIMQQK
jgi:hypothetical protein